MAELTLDIRGRRALLEEERRIGVPEPVRREVQRELVVPTATFRSLYVFVVLAHERRRIVHCNVTDAPCASWTGQQIINAFPDATAPRYLHRDRDAIYGSEFISRVRSMGIEQVVSAARSPWQNPYVEPSSLRQTRRLTF